jgi:methionyl-tRNA formyltransferase
VRALTRPYPGAFCAFRGKKLLVWKARVAESFVGNKESNCEPGVVVAAGKKLVVATGKGNDFLELLELQFEGEPACSAQVFCESYSLTVGERQG